MYYEFYTEEFAAQKECLSQLTQKEILRFVSSEMLRRVAGQMTHDFSTKKVLHSSSE